MQMCTGCTSQSHRGVTWLVVRRRRTGTAPASWPTGWDAAVTPASRVMHSQAKDGLGAATWPRFGCDGVAGLPDHRGRGTQGDGSHPPEDLQRDCWHELGRCRPRARLALVRGGSVVKTAKNTRVMSRGGNLYYRLAMGDHQGHHAGFRVFPDTVLARLALGGGHKLAGYASRSTWVMARGAGGFRGARTVTINVTETARRTTPR